LVDPNQVTRLCVTQISITYSAKREINLARRSFPPV